MASLWFRFCSKKRNSVKAMNHGIVTLSEDDLYYTGGTLFLIMVMDFNSLYAYG